MNYLDEIIGNQRSLLWVLKFWPVLASSLIAGLLATSICKRIAIRFGITDKPDNSVKTHKEPVAYLGGIGILVGLLAGIISGLYCASGEPQFIQIFKMLLGIMAGATIACLVGVVDDILDIKPWQKLAGQLAAALTLIVCGILPSLHYFTDPLSLDMPRNIEVILAIPVVVIFVLGATNSLNLLDGLDGLCGGVTAIISLGMLILSIHLSTWYFSETGDPVRIILSLSLVGGVLGFLPFNRHPAKIFMGDAGSLLLGFSIASLMILFGETIPRWWMSSIIIFGLPILDTATALVRRKINGRPLMVSDRGHIYDQMMDRGYGLRKTVKICYAIACMYAIIGLAMSQIRTKYALVVYVLVFAFSAFVIWKKGFLKMDGIRGVVRKEKY